MEIRIRKVKFLVKKFVFQFFHSFSKKILGVNFLPKKICVPVFFTVLSRKICVPVFSQFFQENFGGEFFAKKIISWLMLEKKLINITFRFHIFRQSTNSYTNVFTSCSGSWQWSNQVYMNSPPHFRLNWYWDERSSVSRPFSIVFIRTRNTVFQFSSNPNWHSTKPKTVFKFLIRFVPPAVLMDLHPGIIQHALTQDQFIQSNQKFLFI